MVEQLNLFDIIDNNNNIDKEQANNNREFDPCDYYCKYQRCADCPYSKGEE